MTLADGCTSSWWGVSRVVVRFLVCIRQGLSEALDDAHKLERWVCAGQCVRENVASGQVDRLLVQVVCENDESGGELGSICENVFECGDDSRGGDGACSNVPVVGVKVVTIVTCPNDGGEAHGEADSSHTIVNVSVGWAEGVWGDTG